jgi:hypothetical protein
VQVLALLNLTPRFSTTNCGSSSSTTTTTSSGNGNGLQIGEYEDLAGDQEQEEQEEEMKEDMKEDMEEDMEEGVASSFTSSRAIQEAEQVVFALNAREAAMVMHFARCSALRAQMLTFNLGAATRAAQAKAICRRLLLEPEPGESYEDVALHRLPAHCTHMFVCSECKRVANARQNGSGKDLGFNEVGLSASMLRIDGSCTNGFMKCAKRSSAALRTAVALEDAANRTEVESMPVKITGKGDGADEPQQPIDMRPASIVAALHGNRNLTGRETASEVAKLRRDIKGCYEQHSKAIACGDVPLVKIPILGKAIRIFDEWNALCASCGALTKIHPTSRFGGEPCCMRCDFEMLHGKEAAKAMKALLPKPPAPSCRYCGKVQPEGSSGRWKVMAAPADTGGRNAAVPPPLRTVW